MADTEALVNQLNECASTQDFAQAFKLVRENRVALDKNLQGGAIKDLLKKTTQDRLLLSFVEASGFGANSLDESLVRLEKLVSFRPGALVLSEDWGLGEIKRLDYFYRKITVDFRTRRGHQFSFDAAIDMLEIAAEDHIQVLRHADPVAFEAMRKDRPGDFVKAVIKSYGEMSVQRLEDLSVRNGFVKAAEWKKFWEDARAALKKDKLVEVPVKRSEPIRLKATAEDYGEGWLTAFSHETDPKLILAAVREFVDENKFATADETAKAKIGDRLGFAVTAARKVDDALYSRLACLVSELGYASPSAAEMRDYLWERKRFIAAANDLPAREVKQLLSFLAVDDESKAKLYRAIGSYTFSVVQELVALFGCEAGCRMAIGEELRSPKAPATVVTLVVGKYESFREWTELPTLLNILMHAIALGEGRQSGETLKMQNMVRRLFGDRKWLEKVFGWLNESEQVVFFERFQASIAWDASTHHATVVRMTKIAPVLEGHIVKAEKKKEYARATSMRSYAERKLEYLKLINETMPANIKRIEEAKSYGDLSENAEYQYAKDEQRALLQKQTKMQADLDAVKPDDFLSATTDEVMPGVSVVAETDGGERTWHILGEWDNDVEKGILSSKTLVAQNMMGKKVGESFELPAEDGAVKYASIKAILPLGEDIREWMKLPEGVQI
jgi:transcription elongation GreA/GreB family factor